MYTQVKIKKDYREKLQKIAEAEHRSMANIIEVLIDEKLAKLEER